VASGRLCARIVLNGRTFPYAPAMRKWGITLRVRGLLPALFAASVGLGSGVAWGGVDSDGDGWDDTVDNCPTVPNQGQENADEDEIGNACDNCPNVSNQSQTNTDGDAQGDACDTDLDGDGVLNVQDNCKSVPNPEQINTDGGKPGGDGAGDACDEDDDADNIKDPFDNCPLAHNYDQADHDEDAAGDVCDEDDDNDGLGDFEDNCPFVANGDMRDAQNDNDGDGIGDACDEDDDNDGVSDEDEAGVGLDPLDADTDNDGIKDGDESCEPDVPCAALDPNSDADGDGILDKDEAGDLDSGSSPVDSDDDGVPDYLDEDSDEDGTPDSTDKCLGAVCANGGTCTTGADCGSGNCVGGICCNAPCTGVCETCNANGQCVLQPEGYDPFSSGSCVGDIIIGVECSATGEVQPKETIDCAPYKCVEGACLQECTDDEDCADTLGYCAAGACKDKKPDNSLCDVANECLSDLCVFGVCGVQDEPTCAADGYTYVFADGETTESCSPYACKNAACLLSCTSVNDCAPGFVCGLDGQCVTEPAVIEDGGCAVPASPASGRGLEALLALPLLSLLRRRRRAR
jgi:Thrombospondin type 3 repeat